MKNVNLFNKRAKLYRLKQKGLYTFNVKLTNKVFRGKTD